MEICHCTTCGDRLHVIIVINAIAIRYSLAFCLIKFFTHMHSFHFTVFFYALPIVHDNSSKNAQVSPATTSIPWRHTNTSKNHGYNAVTDNSGQVSSATTWRHTNTRKNHGYNVVAEVSCSGSHVVLRISYSLSKKKIKNIEKGQIFLDHTYYMVSSRRRGMFVQSLVQIDWEMWICIRYKQTNKQKTNKKPFQLYV
jgi:hypothetical protein